MARILAVDDELTILDVVSTLLQADGHEVTTELEAEKAKELITSEEFDLLISDIRMVPVSGMELLRFAHENAPDMMVIMLTAYGQVETALEAMELGAFDYIKKPFRPNHLMDIVNKALTSREIQANDKLGPM